MNALVEELLLDPQFIAPLQQLMLPLLTAHDLGKLAASCQAMRRLVLTADPRTWQTAAKKVLHWRQDLPR